MLVMSPTHSVTRKVYWLSYGCVDQVPSEVVVIVANASVMRTIRARPAIVSWATKPVLPRMGSVFRCVVADNCVILWPS